VGWPAAQIDPVERNMSVIVRVPPVFRPMAGGQAKVEAEGATVAEVIASLEANHPGFSAKLLDDEGNLVKFVNVFVDDDDVRFLDGLATPVADGTEVSIMQAVAGG
jgi:molybdopterin synthase sulfur carrier subunit